VLHMWAKSAGLLAADGGRAMTELLSGRTAALVAAVGDAGRWQSGWWSSLVDDPAWHARWMADVTRKWLRLYRTTRLRDPRVRGPAELRLASSARSG
jgi:hypothetical protein